MPGLVQKIYGRDDATGDVCGIYFFESKEALAAFRETELARTISTGYETSDSMSVLTMTPTSDHGVPRAGRPALGRWTGAAMAERVGVARGAVILVRARRGVETAALVTLLLALVAAAPGGVDRDGPYELREVRYERIVSHDGVELEGWIGLPDVPEGVRVPVALHSTPYLGTCGLLLVGAQSCWGSPDDPTWWEQPANFAAHTAWRVDPIELVRRGYAAAFFSVRGTGNSGGCFDNMGLDEQLDQVEIVNWLAAQPWSNGRVGMGGISAPAITAVEAAIHAPPALKTIVVSGIVSDLYTFNGTPQGAMLTANSHINPRWEAGISLLPPAGGDLARFDPQPFAAHGCQASVESILSTPQTQFSDDRPAAFFDERRLIDGFPDVRAAVLLAQGFQDTNPTSAHTFQESAAWQTLVRAPKRQIEGQWGHDFPFPEVAQLDPRWRNDEWSEVLFDWLDAWLKQTGRPERLGFVDYQDSAGTWHHSREWPPRQAADEVLYLAGEQLSPTAEGSMRSFRAVHDIRNTYPAASTNGVPLQYWAALCEGQDAPTGAAYLGPELDDDVVLAGNPFAYLRLASDQPGGVVAVHLVELTTEFACGPAGEVTGVDLLAMGAADLRFHRGNFTAEDYPIDTPENVRVDLFNLAEHVPAGHRLAVIVSAGDGIFTEFTGQPHAPQIEVRADGDALASHVVLPLVGGTLGGAQPILDYPPRPFVPDPDDRRGPQPRRGPVGGN